MKIKLADPNLPITILISLLWIVLLNIAISFDSPVFTLILGGIFPLLLLILYFFIKPEIFLYLTVFFIPLSVKTDFPGGFSVSVPAEIMAFMLLLYFIVYFRLKRIPDRRIFTHPFFIILVAYLAWLFITSATSEYPMASFKHTFIQILYFLVFYLFFLLHFNKTEAILKFYIFYALGLIIPIVNGMIWHSSYNFNPQASYYMPQPFFVEHTIYGAALAFIIPVMVYLVFYTTRYRENRIIHVSLVLLLLLIVAAEFLASSRAAWLSLFALPFFWLLLKLKIKQVVLWTGLLIIIVIGYLNLGNILRIVSRDEASSNRGTFREQIESVANIQTDISNRERINRWKCALRMFKDRPVTGFGPGTYQFFYYRYQVKKEMTRISTYHGDKGNAHSEYLGSLAETGFAGFLIYISLVFVSVSSSIKVIYRTHDREIRNLSIAVLFSLLTFYVHTLFNGFLETDKIGSLVYGSLAAITALDVYFLKEK